MVNTSTSVTSELKHLWRIGWPLLLAQAAQMGTGVVDTIMAARFGDKDLAAIAIGFHIWLPLYLIVLGVMFASSSIVAQDFGAGRLQRIKINYLNRCGSRFSEFVGSALCYLSPGGLPWLGIDALTVQKSGDYIRMVAFGLPAIGIFMALRYHTQGLGITSPFAVAAVIGFFANIPLNYVLIFGFGDIPAMGAKGCGIATAISMWLSALIITVYVLNKDSLKPYMPPWTAGRTRFTCDKKYTRIGVSRWRHDVP
jgi:MATE family multidrug resistance protein